MLHQINAEPWNQLAPNWAHAMQAALIHGMAALTIVVVFWALFRRNMSHAFAHGLFLVVPIKAASAALFVAWPVAIAFTVPLPEPVLELIHPPNMLMPQAKPAIVSQIQSVDRLEDNPHPAPEIVFNDKPQDIVPVQSLTIDEPVIQQADPVVIVKSPRIKPPFSRWAVVMLAWLACVVMLTIICISNHMRMMRRLHFGHVDNLPANICRLQQISSKIGLRRSPLIWETSAVGTPAVIGLFRPRLLIPRDFFNDFTEDEIQWALLHELAHLRRLDLWWLALERAVGLALFFHPALWLARRATRHFRELACDDTAQIQSGLSPKACAEGFLKLVIWAGRHGQSPTTHTPALSLTDRYPAIQKRIMNMTAPNATHRCARLSRASATAIAALAILVSLPFSPTIVAQAPPVELEVVLNATDDKKPSETSVKQTRPNGFDKELAEIQKLSEQLNSTLPKLDSIKPLNTKAIPVNQPPHDGALIDFPNIINPPDILVVEVLEALQGRPIQGERLVQPDGTISLGFYGRLYVSGLTLDQIKIKLLIHLRQYLSDEALGLVEQTEGGKWKAVDPEKSAKLVVDLAINHSRFYYVQGAVEVPGRYPINGKETVIDAITIAKGLKDDADLTKFSLIRPSHGDEAPRKFMIDWKKISEEGDRKSNLQVFPGDRLIVQKKTTKEAVAAKPELEVRAKPPEPIKSQLKSATGLPLKIGGRVDDPSGKPISGAEIMFLYLADEPVVGFEPKRLPPVKTDTDGTFLIEILPGEFKYAFVQITRPGYASKHIPFNREDARYESFINNNAKIELTEGTTVKGKVYDPDGKPLAGAQVYYSPRMYFSDAHTSISGPDGEFSFENIDKEKPSQVFYAKKPGYGTATIKIARTNGIPSELKLQMTPVREFKATITDIKGKPIAGVVAELRLVNIINGEYELFTTSDAEGKIKFSDLPKGKDIRVLFSRAEFAQKDAFIKGDDLSEKHIQLLKGVTGSGLVRNSQTLQPIDRFQVTLEPQNDQNTLRRNRETGDYRNGTFRLGATTFSPESFQLVIEAEGFKPFRTASYKLDECPVKLDVKLDPIPVAELPHYRGKIIQPDGKPAGRVKIGVVTDKDFPRIQKGQISSTQLGRKIPLTDENGDFDFHTPEPVRELLVLHDSGAIRQIVEPGMDLNKLQMQLQPFGRLVGSLKRNGKPDLQSRMFLIYQSIQPQFWQTYEQIVLKQDGTFSMDRMIPGNFKISFEPANIDENSRTNTMEAFSIKPGETVRLDRDLKLADVPRRDLVGKLQFPDGKIPGDLSLSRIILLAPEGNPLRGTPDNYISNSEKRLKYRETAEGKALYQSLEEFPLLKKEVSTEGVFRISGLPAGRFELNILPGNANIIYGSAKKIIETTPLKSGELNQPVDLGEIMVERQVQKPPLKAEKPKEAGAVNVKPVSTPTPTMKIGGVVVDETGKPIAGVKVDLTATILNDQGSRTEKQLQLESQPSDPLGKWTIEEVPESVFAMQIRLSHPKYSMLQSMPQSYGYGLHKPFTDLKNGDLRLQMKKGLKVSFQVNDTNGNPMGGAAVFNQFNPSRRRDEKDKPMGFTDSKGLFTCDNAAPGRTMYFVTKIQFGPTVMTVDVNSKTPVQNVVMKPGREISGTLVDWDGKVMSGAEVYVSAFRDTGWVPNLRTKTDVKGHFQIRNMPFEPVVLGFLSNKLSVSKPIEGSVTDMGRVEFGPVHILRAKVVDADTGRPVTATAIQILENAGASNTTVNSTFSSLGVDHQQDGIFEKTIPQHLKKEMVALVLADGYETYVSKPFQTVKGQTITEMKVELKRPSNPITSRGKVMGVDGKPSGSSMVRFITDKPGLQLGKHNFSWEVPEFSDIETSADGTFEFQSSRPVKELLVVGQDDFFYSSDELAWKGEFKQIQLTKKAIIKGKVTSGNLPMAGVQVYTNPSILNDYQYPLWNAVSNGVSTANDGTYQIKSVLPSFYINTNPQNNSSTFTEYKMKPGEIKEVNIDLKP